MTILRCESEKHRWQLKTLTQRVQMQKIVATAAVQATYHSVDEAIRPDIDTAQML